MILFKMRIICVSVNSAAPVFYNLNTDETIWITETTPVAICVFNISVSDADNDTLTLIILNQSPMTKFSLSEHAVLTIAEFDFENVQDRAYTLRIRADDGSTHIHGILNIKIQNEFDEIPIISGPLSAPIQENQPAGTFLFGLFDVTDADFGDTLDYTLSGMHASFFKIDPSTGLVTTSQAFDYEGEITTFDLLLTVTDKGGNSANVSLFISLSDVNEYTPTFNQSTYVVLIDEDSPKDTSVIELFATDADFSQSLAYSVKYGDPWGFFTFDETKTNQININKCINLDSPDNHPSTYSLIVVVTDDGSPKLTGTTYVMITVNRNNDNAPVFGATSPNSTLTVSYSPYNDY
ncbi:hypothetical protein CHS0354_038376 [Potamilus streckersoni]|uniref:Cadherin domain-containing protein n=1 Tax=Potamilus streckersoni TaxID=2493646 RepID=A0AAE0S625_9BIVA|nr:hypothetical protein CHS0354_038376 [Potamilus streckersoni]